MDKGHIPKIALPCVLTAFFAIFGVCLSSSEIHAATSTNVDVTCNVATVLSITASNDISLTDLAAGSFYDQDTTINVMTNNPYGFTLSMSMSKNDASKNNALNLGDNHQIPSISQKTDRNSFPETTGGWGYAVLAKDANFFPLPSVTGNTYESVELKRTSVGTGMNPDSTIVTVGVRPGKTAIAGTYTNIVTFTAVVNPVPNNENPEDPVNPQPQPDQNGTDNVVRTAASPSRARSAMMSTGSTEDQTDNSDGMDANNGNVDPQGVVDVKKNDDKSNIRWALIAIAISAAAMMFFFIILAVKRDDDDDEDEEAEA